jgi:riboflavin kinase/FMN adenylyltransferase
MRIFHNLDELPTDWGATVISIGNFDGVHRGHQFVLGRIHERARNLNAHALAVTFDPHPARILRPGQSPALITPLPQKLAAMERTPVEAVLIIPFTEDFARITPTEFAKKIIADRLKAREVHEGANFHFGYRAQGDCAKLKILGDELGFAVYVYPQMQVRNESVSSSRIRQLLLDGNVGRARLLLGRAFSIVSTPASGRGYGTRYTVPTINLAAYTGIIPKKGVYVTCTRVGDEQFESVTNVGTRPTFDGESFAVETHLLNFHPIPLNESTDVEVTFLKWLRPEVKWPNPEALKSQISKDIARATRFFALAKARQGASASPHAKFV